ncbi:hypothetical protein SLEP1_g26999 [Rubroshorea leprosula]|uniref:Uncharacterized protein n=1 Tax=Rubroshorea leprosula TaxID=152421 RepID=A0AAV5JY86_9ROSI|nr:hypothetical protein SLEP1_g26999 [Rubroshorea leprosula]
MTDPLRLLHLRTTSQILKRTTTHFFSNLFTFLLLSFLLFSFRSLVESGSIFLTSVIDRDPSIKSLLSRLDLHPNHPHERSQPSRRQTRRPFLHLTRVGTLDDDLFSSDDDHRDRSLFGFLPNPPSNGTPMVLSNFDPKLGFSNFVTDNGIFLPEVVRYGVKFKTAPFDNIQQKLDLDGEQEQEQEQGQNSDGQESDRIVDFQFFIKGLELGRRDAAALFFLVSVMSAAYGWVILGFTAIYSWVMGVIFVTVVNDLIGGFVSFFGAVWDGSRLGLKRLGGFILMRWAVRDALTQLLGLWYFGEVEDQYSFFKLFVRLKLMPFSVMSPWIRGFEREISGFLLTWFLLDTLVAFIFSLDAWIAIVDSRRSGREIVKEGCYLLSTMLNPAIQIKFYEAILGGSLARGVLTRIGGDSFAAVCQAAFEVYFIVAWLIFYFAARCTDANAEARTFGRRELEVVIEGLR